LKTYFFCIDMSQSQTQDNRAVDVFVDDSESRSVQGIQKRSRKRFEVWKHFNEAEPTKVKCKHCHNMFVHGPKMGTTYLHRHLERGKSYNYQTNSRGEKKEKSLRKRNKNNNKKEEQTSE
jgi:BED zinc finger